MIKTLGNFFSVLTTGQKNFFYKLQFLIIISSILEIVSVAGLALYFSMILDLNNLILKLRSISYFESFTDHEIYIFSGISLILIFFISSMLNILSIKFQNSFTENIGSDFTQRLYNFYLNQTFLYFVNNDINIILKKITADTSRFTDQFLRGLVTLISKVTICILIFVILIFYNPEITLTVFFIILCFYFITRKLFKKKIDKAGKEITIKTGYVYDYVSSSLNGIREVLFYERQNFLKKNLRENLNNIASNKSFLKTIGNVPRFFIEFISFSVLISLIIFFSIINTSLDSIIFNLAIFGSAGYKLLPAMQAIYYSMTDLYGNKDSFEVIYPELFNEKKYIENKKLNNNKIKINQIDSIKLDNVSFSYKDKKNLNKININFKQNQKIGIIGKSGSGKSTLIDLILGFIQPSEGKIQINTRSIENLSLNNIRENIGFVPQNIFLFNDTIEKNISLDKKIDEQIISQLSNICLLSDFLETNKIDISNDKIGNYGKMLSGGQRQRVGIARALYNKPKILILDEATNALDSLNQNKIISNIIEYTNVNIVILITHNTNLLKDFDKIIVLDDGNIVAEGTFKNLEKENNLFNQLKKNFDNN